MRGCVLKSRQFHSEVYTQINQPCRVCRNNLNCLHFSDWLSKSLNRNWLFQQPLLLSDIYFVPQGLLLLSTFNNKVVLLVTPNCCEFITKWEKSVHVQNTFMVYCSFSLKTSVGISFLQSMSKIACTSNIKAFDEQVDIMSML